MSDSAAAAVPPPTVVDRARAEHYRWGDGCDGWRLLRHPELSVIEEQVPAGAAERAHRHARARQFFYLLAGCATLEFDDASLVLQAGQGVHVAPGVRHRFVNHGAAPVRFLVISAPDSAGDRSDD
jgi:mannose-6-phosphate isomerase-like protein (cupin superfamily)